MADEFPFEIPESWVWVRLGEFINLVSGQDLTPDKYSTKKIGIPYITGASNILENKLHINRYTNFATKIANRGDLLITCKGTIGEMLFLEEDKVHIARQIMSIRTSQYLNKKYLHFYLISYINTLKSVAKSMIPGISRDDILSIVFPLPPLNEQKHIVAKLEEILPFIEEYDRKEQKLTALNQQFPEQLKKSILQAAIQGKLVEQDPNDKPASEIIKHIQAEKERLISEKKIKKPKVKSEIVVRDNLPYEIVDGVERCIADEMPFEIPESWAWMRLENYCNNHDSQRKPVSVEYRKHQKKIYDYYGATGVIDKVEEYLFDGRYVLIGEDGGNFFVNRDNAFIAEGQFWANNHVHVLSTLFELEKYFCFFLNALNLPAMGVINGIAVPKLNQKNLNNILIAVPPIGEQKRIVQKIEELFSHIEYL